MQTAPDLDLLETRPDQVRPLTCQGLTHGLQFAEALKPLFVAFSPAATGYAMNWPPHSIAIDFGGLMDLRLDPPISREHSTIPMYLDSKWTIQESISAPD